MKNAIVVIDGHLFEHWYETHYGVAVGIKKGKKAPPNAEEGAVSTLDHVKRKLVKRQAERTLDPLLDEQFASGRFIACISPAPASLAAAIDTSSRARSWGSTRRCSPRRSPSKRWLASFFREHATSCSRRLCDNVFPPFRPNSSTLLAGVVGRCNGYLVSAGCTARCDNLSYKRIGGVLVPFWRYNAACFFFWDALKPPGN